MQSIAALGVSPQHAHCSLWRDSSHVTSAGVCCVKILSPLSRYTPAAPDRVECRSVPPPCGIWTFNSADAEAPSTYSIDQGSLVEVFFFVPLYVLLAPPISFPLLVTWNTFFTLIGSVQQSCAAILLFFLSFLFLSHHPRHFSLRISAESLCEGWFPPLASSRLPPLESEVKGICLTFVRHSSDSKLSSAGSI